MCNWLEAGHGALVSPTDHYPEGVLSEGADADLLLVDDNLVPGHCTAALTAVYRCGHLVFRCRP